MNIQLGVIIITVVALIINLDPARLLASIIIYYLIVFIFKLIIKLMELLM